MAKASGGIKSRRKALFYASLQLGEMTLKEWAAGQDVTPEHVRFVLNGRPSRRLENAIEAFIGRHFPARRAS